MMKEGPTNPRLIVAEDVLELVGDTPIVAIRCPKTSTKHMARPRERRFTLAATGGAPRNGLCSSYPQPAAGGLGLVGAVAFALFLFAFARGVGFGRCCLRKSSSVFNVSL